MVSFENVACCANVLDVQGNTPLMAAIEQKMHPVSRDIVEKAKGINA